RVLLSPINSGNARRRPAPRSPRLFVPYHEWSDQGWPVIEGQRRSRSVMPAEIVLEGHLPLEPFLTGIRKMPGSNEPSRCEPCGGEEKRDACLTAAFSQDERRARL